MENSNQYDVIIVGAGFAGLAAARKLEIEKPELKILMLEADEEIGGRSFTQVLDDGTLIELGGQWIGDKHLEMLKLIKEFNLQTYVTADLGFGKSLYYYNNQFYDVLDNEFISIIKLIDEMTNSINLEAPWNHPKVKKWDNITFQKFIDKLPYTREVKRLLSQMITAALLSTDSDKISLLQALFYIASNAGFDYASSIIDGAQHYRILGGVLQIAQNIVKNLRNTDIILNEEVEIVNDTNDQVIITTMSNKQFFGKYCILAISPVVISSDIQFVQPLPKDYQKFLASFQPGAALKVHFVYKEPFWRKNSLTGFVTTSRGWMTEIVDNSTPNSNRGILTAFIYGSKRKEILKMSLELRQHLLTKELSVFFGQEAMEVIDYLEFNWADNSWTGGCFAANLKPGAWTKYGKWWKQPYGLVHFAGTETSSNFYGYFEGALLSGYRVSEEILKLLKTKETL